MDERINKLKEANNAITRRKQRRKKRLQRGGTLTVAKGAVEATQINVDALWRIASKW
jgi:CRISPR/Cas system CMR subunit Cmr4 (Cas7 group RAMP superfamily)